MITSLTTPLDLDATLYDLHRQLIIHDRDATLYDLHRQLYMILMLRSMIFFGNST